MLSEPLPQTPRHHRAARLRLASSLLILCGGLVQAQALGPTAGVNPQVDPFAVSAGPSLPPPPPGKLTAMPLPALPPAPVFGTPQTLPAGLRAILIRDNGQGLLGSADGYAIVVSNGKTLRLGEQEYRVEVTQTEIRLYAAPHGRLVWEGTLGGPAPVSLPADISQLRFIPPLSAGVNPGLKSGASSLGQAVDPVTKISD
jgi:hypothetical protein